MAVVEEACSRLPPLEADELRADTSHLLKNHCPHNKSNISKVEYKAIKELMKDQTRVVLTADKGVAMVVMDKKSYTDKALTLLTDTIIYNTISRDPTTRLRNKNISTLKDIKGGLINTTCRKLYPTSAVLPSFMAFPKSTKQALPLDPSCPVEVPYLWVGKGVSRHHLPISRLVTTPHQNQSPHHIRNTQHFVQHIQQVKLEPGEVMAFYDVKALFTSVPVDPPIHIVQQKL